MASKRRALNSRSLGDAATSAGAPRETEVASRAARSREIAVAVTK